MKTKICKPMHKKKKRVIDHPFFLLLLCLFFYADNFPTLVMTAIGANRMGKTHLTTVAALHQIQGFQPIMRAPAITPTLGNFPLRKRNHDISPI